LAKWPKRRFPTQPRLAMPPGWSRPRARRSCTTRCSWPTSAFSIHSTVTSWEKEQDGKQKTLTFQRKLNDLEFQVCVHAQHIFVSSKDFYSLLIEILGIKIWSKTLFLPKSRAQSHIATQSPFFNNECYYLTS
jgi:hypothetical protein